MGEVLSLSAKTEKLELRKCSRSYRADNVITFAFNRDPTDEEIQFLHDVMKRAVVVADWTKK